MLKCKDMGRATMRLDVGMGKLKSKETRWPEDTGTRWQEGRLACAHGCHAHYTTHVAMPCDIATSVATDIATIATHSWHAINTSVQAVGSATSVTQKWKDK